MPQQYNENVDSLIKYTNELFKNEVISEYQYNFILNSLKKMENAKPSDSTLNLASSSRDSSSFKKNYALYTNPDKFSKNINLSTLSSFRLKTQNNLYIAFVDDKLTLLTQNEVLTNSNNQLNTIINIERISNNKGEVLNHFYLRFEGFSNSNNYLTLGENDKLNISKKNNLKSLWKLIRNNNFFMFESIFQKDYFIDTSQRMRVSMGASETTKWIIEENTTDNSNISPNSLYTETNDNARQIISQIDNLIESSDKKNQEVLKILREIALLEKTNSNNKTNLKLSKLKTSKNIIETQKKNKDKELEQIFEVLDNLINEKKSEYSNTVNINRNISKKINDINNKSNETNNKREKYNENLRVLNTNLEILEETNKKKTKQSKQIKLLTNGIITMIVLLVIVIISRFILK